MKDSKNVTLLALSILAISMIPYYFYPTKNMAFFSLFGAFTGWGIWFFKNLSQPQVQFDGFGKKSQIHPDH